MEAAEVKSWTCFHCDETFTDEKLARLHFGPTVADEPGCLIKVRLGAERGLLLALREAEERIARYMENDSDVMRSMHGMQARHARQLVEAEEAGYLRGICDARAEMARKA